MDVPYLPTGSRLIVLCAAMFAASLIGNDCFAQQRTWTDASGTFKIEATLVEVKKTDDGLQAQLVKADGKRMAILLSQLSESDATLAKQFLAEASTKDVSPKTEPTPKAVVAAQPKPTVTPEPKPEATPQPLTDPATIKRPLLREAQVEDGIVSRPLSAPINMARRKLDNRFTTNVEFNPETAIRLEREIPRDERGRPTENPVYLVKVTEKQMEFLPQKFRAIVDDIRDEKVAIDVKRRAIEKLKTSWPQGRHPGLLNVLINALSHDDKFLRLAALDLLANHDSDQSLIYIFARIDDISFDVRWRTFEVLTQLRDPRIIPELCERLAGADRTKVASVLRVFGTTAAPMVHEWAKVDQVQKVLLNVCQLLGDIGDTNTLPVLAKLESHESLLVRSQAKNSIKEINLRLSQRASKAPTRR